MREHTICGRALRRNGAAVIDRNVAAGAARIRSAPDTDKPDGIARRTAATANRLRENADAAGAARRYGSGVVDRYRAAWRGSAAPAAKREKRAARAAGAPATSDRLGQNTYCAGARGGNRTRGGNGHVARGPAGRARATAAEEAAEVAAGSSAAADRLGQNPVSLGAAGDDRAGLGDGGEPGVDAGAARSAVRNDTTSSYARSARATDARGLDAIGRHACGCDASAGRYLDVAGPAAGAAITAVRAGARGASARSTEAALTESVNAA